MKANELMIGDCVYNPKNERCKICSIEGIGEPYATLDNYDKENNGCFEIECDLTPIPLVADILENNGFYASEVSPHHIKYVCSTGPIGEFADIVLICGKDNKDKWRWDCLDLRIHYYRGDIHQFKINYVHELQHAMRLCGLEKEIEL